MKGWQLFTHSARQVFGNLGAALRISAVLYLAQIAVAIIVGFNVFAGQAALQAQIDVGGFPWGAFVATLLFSSISGLWIAVGWHRYVLLVEQPGAALPEFHGDRMFAYFGRSLLIALIVGLVGVALGVCVGLVTALVGQPGTVLVGILTVAAIMVPVLIISFRLSGSLPSAALGAQAGIADTWRMTAGQTGAFLTLAVIAVVLSVVIDLPAKMIFAPASIASGVWLAITGWVKLMVGISILTTLYGHYIEGRELT